MIEVLGSNLLIEPIKESNETPGGIILPDRAMNVPKFGTVRFIGPKVSELKCGDVIVLPSWDGDKIKIDNVDYIVTDEKNIDVKIS